MLNPMIPITVGGGGEYTENWRCRTHSHPAADSSSGLYPVFRCEIHSRPNSRFRAETIAKNDR